MTNNKSKTMRTEKKKQSCNGNNSAIKADSTQSFESRFSEEPQSNLNSSDSGQQYDIVDNSPFAVVKQGDVWKIVIGSLIASPHDFPTKEIAVEYVREYSLLDGANKIKPLAKKLKEFGMKSVVS